MLNNPQQARVDLRSGAVVLHHRVGWDQVHKPLLERTETAFQYASAASRSSSKTGSGTQTVVHREYARAISPCIPKYVLSSLKTILGRIRASCSWAADACLPCRQETGRLNNGSRRRAVTSRDRSEADRRCVTTGAGEGTRTPTGFRPPGPKPGASSQPVPSCTSMLGCNRVAARGVCYPPEGRRAMR